MLSKLGWMSWDRLCYILSHGSVEELANFVANPEKFVKHREELPVVGSDAVPVYLDTATGKILVSTRVLDAANRRRIAKAKGIEPEELTEDVHIVAEGASRQDKDRLTWICRQVLHNVFAKVSKHKPAPRIKGSMLPSILLAHCNTCCRVENICPDTDTWLEDEEFWLNGTHVVRKAGDPVPEPLMRSWRELRRKEPELFQQGVLIWGSPNAYQNEVTCAMMSKELEQHCPNGCLHQVDMFSGELTETMESLNFMRNQVKTIVPPKLTSKGQVTDLGFARDAKAAGNAEKEQVRRDQRRKARDTGVAARLEAGCYEMLRVTIAMHKRCVQEASEGKVEQTWRKAAWPAYEPTEKGWQRAEGERWENLPLGGSNYPEKYMRHRFTNLDEEGIPMKPDWGELHELRRKQRESAADDKRIKAKGTEVTFRPKLGRAKKKKN